MTNYIKDALVFETVAGDKTGIQTVSSALNILFDIAINISEGPRHPNLHSFPKTQFGKQKRSFSSSIYERFPYIEYSVHNYAVFCFPCRLCSASSGYVENIFTETGFRDCKKLSERLTKHSDSSVHKESMIRWMLRKSSDNQGTVIEKIHQQSDSAVDRNREVIETLARVCILCGRQDIALRGHDESSSTSNPGIYRALVDLLRLANKSFEDIFQQLPKNATYLSKDSQNDLLSASSDVISDCIVNEIKEAGMFTVIADDARDVSCTEQTSVCVRYVLGSRVIERFLQFVDVHDLDSLSLSNVIFSTFETKGIDVTKCVAQCYDGASVMSGRIHGVQARFRDMCGTPCIYVHCYAHRLNLVLVDACSDIRCLTDYKQFIVLFVSPLSGMTNSRTSN